MKAKEGLCPKLDLQLHARMQELMAHPKKPTAQRIEELAEAWVEGGLAEGPQLQEEEQGVPDFDTSTAFLPPALFNKDPEFERSIFIPGAEALSSSPVPTGPRDRGALFITTLKTPGLYG
jgi:hypothetical protein